MKYLALIFALFAANAGATTYGFTKSNNKVTWVAIGTPGFLRINGEGGAAEGQLNADAGKVSGALEVALDDYKTGIALRDEHMKKKYLETSKYPKAKLVFKEQPYKEGEGNLIGELTIKDTTKPVKVFFNVSGKKVHATLKVNLKDYPSVGVPCHLGITVADEVEVRVDATAS